MTGNQKNLRNKLLLILLSLICFFFIVACRTQAPASRIKITRVEPRARLPLHDIHCISIKYKGRGAKNLKPYHIIQENSSFAVRRYELEGVNNVLTTKGMQQLINFIKLKALWEISILKTNGMQNIPENIFIFDFKGSQGASRRIYLDRQNTLHLLEKVSIFLGMNNYQAGILPNLDQYIIFLK
ncbi:MAG TPA: hypothetical protein VKS21_11315 [Spirochaetota bacterium]|nr:hypothetical protein [Spirochaetota bacterium]